MTGCCYALGEEEMVMMTLQAMAPLAVRDRQIFVPVANLNRAVTTVVQKQIDMLETERSNP